MARTKPRTGGRECFHCKHWVAEGEKHDCWTTTEAALTRDLSEDLRDAWDRLRESAVEFGEQRIYASHHSIMFARKSCYFYVRPKTKYLEVVVFLDRAIKAPRVRQVVEASKTRRANIIRITHRDEVEPPITDWLREAYDFAAPGSDNARRKKAILTALAVYLAAEMFRALAPVVASASPSTVPATWLWVVGADVVAAWFVLRAHAAE